MRIGFHFGHKHFRLNVSSYNNLTICSSQNILFVHITSFCWFYLLQKLGPLSHANLIYHLFYFHFLLVHVRLGVRRGTSSQTFECVLVCSNPQISYVDWIQETIILFFVVIISFSLFFGCAALKTNFCSAYSGLFIVLSSFCCSIGAQW